jgi:hypothetical protein
MICGADQPTRQALSKLTPQEENRLKARLQQALGAAGSETHEGGVHWACAQAQAQEQLCPRLFKTRPKTGSTEDDGPQLSALPPILANNSCGSQ